MIIRTCPKVRHFWIWVYSLIYSVTKVKIIKDPQFALLNDPVENIQRSTQTLIYYMFLAAKIAIGTVWKSPMINLTLIK